MIDQRMRIVFLQLAIDITHVQLPLPGKQMNIINFAREKRLAPVADYTFAVRSSSPAVFLFALLLCYGFLWHSCPLTTKASASSHCRFPLRDLAGHRGRLLSCEIHAMLCVKSQCWIPIVSSVFLCVSPRPVILKDSCYCVYTRISFQLHHNNNVATRVMEVNRDIDAC